MGAAVGGLGACCAACAGGALATCCCKVAGAGRTDTTTATRMLLVWLQVFTTFLALVCSAHPWTWIGYWFCSIPGFGKVGPCYCDDSLPNNVHNEECWMEQMIYRAEFSGCCVFLFVLLLCVSGCSDTAAHGYAVAKFMMVPVLILAFLFVPNQFFNLYGNVANILASIFVIVQALLLVDVGYTINEKIMSQHTQHMAEFSPRTHLERFSPCCFPRCGSWVQSLDPSSFSWTSIKVRGLLSWRLCCPLDLVFSASLVPGAPTEISSHLALSWLTPFGSRMKPCFP